MNLPCQVAASERRNDSDDNVSEDYYHSQPQRFKGLSVDESTLLLLVKYAKGYFSSRQYHHILFTLDLPVEYTIELQTMIDCLPVDVIEEHLEKIKETYGVAYLYEMYGVSSPENI